VEGGKKKAQTAKWCHGLCKSHARLDGHQPCNKERCKKEKPTKNTTVVRPTPAPEKHDDDIAPCRRAKPTVGQQDGTHTRPQSQAMAPSTTDMQGKSTLHTHGHPPLQVITVRDYQHHGLQVSPITQKQRPCHQPTRATTAIDRLIGIGRIGIYEGLNIPHPRLRREQPAPNVFRPRAYAAKRRPSGHITDEEHYAFALQVADMSWEEIMAS